MSMPCQGLCYFLFLDGSSWYSSHYPPVFRIKDTEGWGG